MKQTFKEWLELQMAAHFKPTITWAEILDKYNELEPQPKEDELELAPKTKKVFSLEKFVITSKKLGNTDNDIRHYLENWGFKLVGKTEDEIEIKLGLLTREEWFVEVEE